MKSIYIACSFFLLAILTTGCKKDPFVKLNTNPTTLYDILPEEQFLNVPYLAHHNALEAFYDNNRMIMPWSQLSTFSNGNDQDFLLSSSNFNTRLKMFYPDLGAALTDVQHLIDIMPAEEKAKRIYMRVIPGIMKIYYAFYVSDINGSIVYSEGFQARYGGTVTPKYETQEELYSLWNTQLKEDVAALKAFQPAQISLGHYDPYFHGDINAWVKAATALRLRIAMRLMKRDPEKLKSIATDILSDASNLMTSNADSWVFRAETNFTSFSDWSIDGFRPPKPTVDFMWANTDPRLRLFYQENNYTAHNLQTAIDAGKYPPGTTWNPRQYVGAHISPDSSQKVYKTWYEGKFVNDTLTLDTLSLLQTRLFQPVVVDRFNNPGTGINFFPYITYADFCFMRAELAARGVTTENAEQLYYEGIQASIEFYNNAAGEAQIFDYDPVVQSEIDDYKAAPDVLYNSSKAVEQIVIQAYINFFKQPNEAWALIKRTGMPNKNTALANEEIVINGTITPMPRRAPIPFPDPTSTNYANAKAAQEAMMSDPDFGEGPSDIFGRVWWDKK